jgi:hypothetical protein
MTATAVEVQPGDAVHAEQAERPVPDHHTDDTQGNVEEEPSASLLTSLLPMKPAIRPTTIISKSLRASHRTESRQGTARQTADDDVAASQNVAEPLFIYVASSVLRLRACPMPPAASRATA